MGLFFRDEKKENNTIALSSINRSKIFYDKKNDHNYIHSNLLKNMGIVLSADTVISSKIAKKSIVLSIYNN